MVCCRYLKFEYWLSSVERGRFKVSKPSDFEDDYDCVADVSGKINLQVIKKFSTLSANSLTDSAVRLLLCAGRDEVDIYEQRQRSFANDFRHLLLRRDAMDKFLRILCFFNDSVASEDDRHKMWEKYGDNYRGVRVFVDLDKMIGGEFKDVTYTEAMLSCDLSQVDDFPICQYLMEFYKKMVFTKLRGRWGFENEVRYILGVAEGQQRRVLFNDGDFDFISIPFDAITCVDFGYDVNVAACIKDVRRLVDSPLHHVEFRRMAVRSGSNSAYIPLECELTEMDSL